MTKAAKLIVAGVAAASMLVLVAVQHHLSAEPAARNSATQTQAGTTQIQQASPAQAQQTAVAEATAKLVTLQFEQQPQAEGAAELVCLPSPPNPGDLAPITHFTCGIRWWNGANRQYTVTIPAGWQEGQEPFTSVDLISSSGSFGG